MLSNKILKQAFYLSLIVTNVFLNLNVAKADNENVIVVPDVPQTLSAGDIHPPVVPAESATNGEAAYPNQRTFIISAYYSPVPGQLKYVTGSYAGDIRLNGGGVKAADGTRVFPGMIAAPKSYAFGTKMKIPGIGTVAVHDRGGAIVHSGERGNSHDRLDVWMGYGDAGLTRALKWGKRTLDVTVYGINPVIKEDVYLEGYSEAEKIPDTLSPSNDEKLITFNSPAETKNSVETPKENLINVSLTIGSNGPEVAKLQNMLKSMNYYKGDVTSVFNEETSAAVAKFQVDQNIVAHEKAYGAGYVGPMTSKVLAAQIGISTARAESENVTPGNVFNRDLNIGDNGSDVEVLQAELKKMNLLGIEPTGYYGEVTSHAVFKFQQTRLLAGDLSSRGAGIFGPITRENLNSLISERQRVEKLVASRKPDEN